MLHCTNENKAEVVNALIKAFNFDGLTIAEQGSTDMEDPLDYITVLHAFDGDGAEERLSFHVRFDQEEAVPTEVYALLLSNGGMQGSLPDWVIQHVMVSAINANGSPDLYFCTLILDNESQYDLGQHYDKAEYVAEDDGYEGEMIAFDHAEMSAITRAAKIIERLNL